MRVTKVGTWRYWLNFFFFFSFQLLRAFFLLLVGYITLAFLLFLSQYSMQLLPKLNVVKPRYGLPPTGRRKCNCVSNFVWTCLSHWQRVSIRKYNKTATTPTPQQKKKSWIRVTLFEI